VAVKVAEVQNMARHILTLVLWLSLESAVQLRRGDEVNRQADMANTTKCGDLLPVHVSQQSVSCR
jgi:hypothetical protein